MVDAEALNRGASVTRQTPAKHQKKGVILSIHAFPAGIIAWWSAELLCAGMLTT